MIVGASGMLGSALCKHFAKHSKFEVQAVVREPEVIEKLNIGSHFTPVFCSDITNFDHAEQIILSYHPDVIINCVGLIKQLGNSENPSDAILLNAMLPHKLAASCEKVGGKFIQISTDCVFSGQRGNYVEDDVCDATDFYGRSKLLGEVTYGNAITLRTSIIGHELNSKRSLLEWFLQSKGQVNGYHKAIFSGLPTNELASVIEKFVIPNMDLVGLFHVSAHPISKCKLLELIASEYNHDIKILRSNDLVIDRSLDSE